MGSDEKIKKQPRIERLFGKLIWLPKERKEEFELMAAKDNKPFATWIQDNVGNFSELEALVRDLHEQATLKDKNPISKLEKIHSKGEKKALSEVLYFIESLNETKP